ncbi:MAG TPA: serine hydrolase domain-containing protein [Vicinamibacteria bacterium]|nr:serine hydrolase domain-containing protein [Vicinamibacteria bacterium]
MRRRAGVLAAAAVALLAGSAAAQNPPSLPAAQIEAVERILTAEMSRWGIPGLSLGVVVDGEIRLANGYGVADLENNVPAKATTLYRLGSISKTLTATAVMQLSEREKLDLDAPIQKYVPGFPEKPWPVTARQLLAHLGGIRNYSEGEFGSTRRYASVGEALAIFKDGPLACEPGTKFLYSTYGYTLLGAALEGATGESYLDHLRKQVLEPAGMERTVADDALAVLPNRAQGYVRLASGDLRNSALADTSNKIPGGGLAGTALDLARFVIALENGVLVKKETLARMLTRQAARDGKPSGYGLGVFLGNRRGVREAWHTGGQQRVSTVLYLQPDRRLGVVVLANLEGVRDRLLEVARQVADIAAAR